MSDKLLDIPVTTIKGEQKTLADFGGKAVLVVNTASKCGFTPQFEGLEKLYQAYKDQGLVVLGFPCNQFGQQDPGNEAQISEFCQINYGVTFPMMAKVDVNGKDTHAVYQFLKSQPQGKGMLGDAIKWNFTKFLVDPHGRVVDRFAPTKAPQDLEVDIKTLLAQQ